MMTGNSIPTAQLHYTRIGTGADVLLIHGWASSGRMWSRLTQGLAKQFRFWSVDLSGFGDSSLPDADCPLDMDMHTAALIDFCQVNDLRPRAIIGHSMGGLLALKMALVRPDLAERLVLMSPVVTGRFGKWLQINRVVTSEVGRLAITRSKPLWTLFQSDIWDMFTPMMMIPWFTHPDAAARIRQDFKRADWYAIASALDSIARENLDPSLQRIPHPTLVIVGSQDTTVPPREGRLAARRLPAGRLLELPSVYHQPLDETPEIVIDAVHQFLIET